LEKPSWAPIVLAGALPRELPDLLAIFILGLASTETALIQAQFGRAAFTSLIPLLTVAPTCALASLSNSSRRQREELALFAYGGAGWQIHLRYFVRGAIVALVGVSPQILITATMMARLEPLLLWSVVALVVTGGTFYAAPSLRRTSSLDFTEHFKG
jgi:hypothetical protein